MLESVQFDRKRVIVTGAASGIGLAIAQKFAASGASVVLIDLDAEKAAAATQSIGGDSEADCRGSVLISPMDRMFKKRFWKSEPL